MDNFKGSGVVGVGDERTESDGFKGGEHCHVKVDAAAELLTGGDNELCSFEGSDFETGFEHLLVGQVDDLLDRSIVPEQVQIFMNSNTTSQRFNKIISIDIELGKTVNVLSELYFWWFSVWTGTAVFAGVIVVEDMAIEPLSVLPCVIVLFCDFQVGDCIVEKFGRFEA